MAEPVYRLEDVWLGYEGRMVLQGIEISLYPGQCYALVGPNGAGKSTLLRLLALLVPPTRGRLFFQGTEVSQIADPVAVRRHLGMVSQQPWLFRGRVSANLEAGLRFRGVRRRERQAMVQRVAREFGLEPFLGRTVQELSGGERQKVALARAMAVDPAVLLLDEPTAHLDVQATAEFEQLLRRSQQRSSLTILLVTHDLEQAMRLADEVLVLRQGRLAHGGQLDMPLSPLPSGEGKGDCNGGDLQLRHLRW